MKSDIDSGAPPPPPKGPDTTVAVSSGVRQMSASQLEDELERLLTGARPTQPLGELADDSSPRIPSLVSVWLISQVGEAVGQPKLVKLSKVDKRDLRSLAGVARLVHDALQSLKSARVAS